MRGDIKTEEGEAVLEGIDITLSQRAGSNVLSEWSGHFRKTRVADISPSEFKLELAAGGHGDIIDQQGKELRLLFHRKRAP